jgi:hypothetical protein
MIWTNKLADIWVPIKGERVYCCHLQKWGEYLKTDCTITDSEGKEIDILLVDIGIVNGCNGFMKFRKDTLIPRRMLMESVLAS